MRKTNLQKNPSNASRAETLRPPQTEIGLLYGKALLVVQFTNEQLIARVKQFNTPFKAFPTGIMTKGLDVKSFG